MKSFVRLPLISLCSFLLLPALALADAAPAPAPPVCPGEQNNPFLNSGKRQKRWCDRNADAGRNEEQGSACETLYDTLESSADAYARQRELACDLLQRQLSSCAAKQADQVASLECMASAHQLVAEGHTGLNEYLKNANEEIVAARRSVNQVIERFRSDQEAIGEAQNNTRRAAQAMRRESELSADPVESADLANQAVALESQIPQATAVVGGQLTRAGDGEVTARDGGTSTLAEYLSTISGLQNEQETAAREASTAEEQVAKARQEHTARARQSEQMAQQLRQSAASLGAQPQSEKTATVTNEGESQRIAGPSAKGGDADGPGASSALTGAEGGTTSAYSSSQPASRPSNSGGNYSGLGALASLSSGALVDDTDPLSFTPGQTKPIDQTGASASALTEPGKSTTYMRTAPIGRTEKGLRESVRERLVDGSAPPGAGAAGDSSGSSRAPEGDAQATGAAGKPALVTALDAKSVAASSSSDRAPKERPEEIAASLGQDFRGPSMGLAGSETDAAVNEFLGDMAALVDPSDGLTEAERAAFAPLQSGVRSGGGRSLASVDSAPEALGPDTQPLFTRVSSTIQRSAKKGLVVYGLRHKL